MKHDPQSQSKGPQQDSPDGPQHSHLLIPPLLAFPSPHHLPLPCSDSWYHFPNTCPHSRVSGSALGESQTVSVSSGCCNKNHNLVAKNNRNLLSHSPGAFAVGISGLKQRHQQGHEGGLPRGSVPCLFQLVGAAGIPWLIATPLPPLLPSLRTLSSVSVRHPPCPLSSEDTCGAT